LIVLHDVVGAFGRRFSANADSKPPTHSAAIAQQTRLTAPRNVSSLKLRHMPDLNIFARAQTRYLQKSLNRRCDLGSPGAPTSSPPAGSTETVIGLTVSPSTAR
jgi:hypothetical protein